VRFSRLILCLALTAAAALAQPAQAPNPLLLCGDNQALWLVRPGEGGKNFDVLFRPAGEKWQVLAMGLGGKPGLVASMGGTLQVIFAEPLGHGMFQMNSPDMVPLATPSGPPQWPQGTVPLALCTARNFNGVAKTSLIALVPGNADARSPATAASGLTEPATTVAASAPASRASAAGPGPVEPVCLRPFQFADGKWRALPVGPADSLAPARFAKTGHVLIAVASGKLYRIISKPGGEANEFTVWDNSEGKVLPGWRTLPTEKDLAGTRPVAMFTLADKLAILTAAPGNKAKIHLTMFLLEEPGHFSKCAIQLGQKPFAWDSSSGPVAAGIGDQFEMVWPRDGKLMDSRCALNGQMKQPEEIPTEPAEAGARAFQAYNYFIGAVFVITVVLLALRRDMLPKPFELSPRMVPGNIVKRVLAALLDMTPWFGVAGMVFGLTPDQVQPLFGKPLAVTDNVLFASILFQSLYVIYGTVMETFLGATVGKLIFRLRVVGDQGQRPPLRSIALRNLMKVMELLPIPLSLAIPLPLLLLFPLFSPYRLRIGDIMARTGVVETRLLPPPVSTDPPPESSHGHLARV
jgi:uncharacterized RDD family membrane protein YckC